MKNKHPYTYGDYEAHHADGTNLSGSSPTCVENNYSIIEDKQTTNTEIAGFPQRSEVTMLDA